MVQTLGIARKTKDGKIYEAIVYLGVTNTSLIYELMTFIHPGPFPALR